MIAEMDGFVIGIDGGGTKTRMEVRDLDGKVLYTKTSSGINLNSTPKVNIVDSLTELITPLNYPGELDSGLSKCKYVYISTAGISNPKTEPFLKEVLVGLGITSKIEVVGDQIGALYGAFGIGEGIILISGTGSICYGRTKDGRSHRAGGYGHLVDDEGSGYTIGRDIISSIVRGYDKRRKPTIFHELVLDAIGGERLEDIIEYSYKKATKKEIASFAPLLLQGLQLKDEAAIAIKNKVVSELLDLVHTVGTELGEGEYNIAFLGGILQHYTEIRDEITDQLRSSDIYYHVKDAMQDSASGAAIAAIERVREGKL